MAVTNAFLTTCRNAVGSLAELSAFRTSLASLQSATRAERIRVWHATYSPTSTGQSLAYQLRLAIRNTVNAQADIAGTLSPLDRESAYRTMDTEFVPEMARPLSDDQEHAELEKLLREDELS